jgi:hypothetical protein
MVIRALLLGLLGAAVALGVAVLVSGWDALSWAWLLALGAFLGGVIGQLARKDSVTRRRHPAPTR